MKTTISSVEVFYKLYPFCLSFLAIRKGTKILELESLSCYNWQEGRIWSACLTFLWEDLISFAVKEEKCCSVEKTLCSINMVQVMVGPVWKSEGNTFLWLEYKKTDLLGTLLGFPPKLPDSARSVGAGTMLYAVIQVKPADLMTLCFWVIILC